MSAYFLVIYIYAGMLAKGDSVAIAPIPMQTRELCMEAGKQATSLVYGSTKEFRFVCVKSQQ